jgi:hypothetical protein
MQRAMIMDEDDDDDWADKDDACDTPEDEEE